MSRVTSSFVFVILVVSSLAGLRAESQDDRKLMEEKAPSLVMVKAVYPEGGGDIVKAPGVIVDASGLVMTSLIMLDRQTGVPGMKRAPQVSVIIRGEDREYPARLVERNESLALAFVEILEAAEKHLTPLSFSDEAPVWLGQELLGVTLDPKTAEFEPTVAPLTVAGAVKEPLSMWSLMGPSFVYSLPAFDSQRRAVGFVVVMIETLYTDEPMDSYGMMTGGGLDYAKTPFLLGAGTLRNAILEAMAKARGEPMPEAKEAPAAKPSEGPEGARAYSDIVRKGSQSVVIVRLIGKPGKPPFGIGGHSWLLGTVVDGGSLVAVSLSKLDPMSAMRRELGDKAGLPPRDESNVPEFRVVAPGESAELEAKLVLEDYDLDIALLKIKGRETRPSEGIAALEDISLAQGQEVVAVARHGERFGYAPYLAPLKVSAKIEKPALTWIVKGSRLLMMPVFDLDAKPVGLLVSKPEGVEIPGCALLSAATLRDLVARVQEK